MVVECRLILKLSGVARGKFSLGGGGKSIRLLIFLLVFHPKLCQFLA